jgi:hypothetical protein
LRVENFFLLFYMANLFLSLRKRGLKLEQEECEEKSLEPVQTGVAANRLQLAAPSSASLRFPVGE